MVGELIAGIIIFAAGIYAGRFAAFHYWESKGKTDFTRAAGRKGLYWVIEDGDQERLKFVNECMEITNDRADEIQDLPD